MRQKQALSLLQRKAVRVSLAGKRQDKVRRLRKESARDG